MKNIMRYDKYKHSGIEWIGEIPEYWEINKLKFQDMITMDSIPKRGLTCRKLMFHIFASFAEFERDIIRERTLAGLSAARARGRKGGRKKILSPEKVETAFRMYDSREYTVSTICDNLGIKVRTFYEYLKRRKLENA